MKLKRIDAPWTQQQVDDLNAAQGSGYLHPYTCPGDLDTCHLHRELIATVEGWVCGCDKYRQTWAFEVPPIVLGREPPL